MIQFYIFIIHILYSILRNTDCQGAVCKLMIIHNFNFIGNPVFPFETYTIFIIYPYGILIGTVAF